MKDDWQLNTAVRSILARNWLVSEKLKILSIHGAVLIQGELEFSGTLRREDDIFVVGRKLKKVEQEIMANKEVRSLKWDLRGYRKLGLKGNWERTVGIRRKEKSKEQRL